MSYQPYDRNPSGIVFFGTSASDQLFESNSNFTYNGSVLNVPNITIGNGNEIGSVSYPSAISIDANGDVSFGQDISIAGNLTVNGTTTTVNSQVVTIQDPIIVLGSGVVASGSQPTGDPLFDDNKDRGISFNWHTGNVAKTGFFGFDDSEGKFVFVPDATIVNEIVSGTPGIIIGDLEGNADTATSLETARNFSVAGHVGTSSAVSFNGTANVELSVTLNPSAINDQSTITSIDNASDYFIVRDSTDSSLKKVSRNYILSGLDGSGLGYSNGVLDINDTIITSQPLMSSGDVTGSADQILIYDSGVGLKRITGNDFVAGLDILTSFNVVDENSNSSTLNDGDNIVFSGGYGLTASVTTLTGSPQVTFDVDKSIISGVTNANFEDANDLLLFYDDSADALRTVTQDQLITDIADSVTGVPSGSIMSFWQLRDDVINDDTHTALIYNLTSLQILGQSGIDFKVDGPYKQASIGLRSSVAGSGLNYDSGVLNIGTGTGMSIDGTTVGLANTSVSAGSYGSATQVGSFTVDAQGRLTGASGVNINITASQVSNFNTAAESAIFTSANFVDTDTIDFTVTTGASVSGVVKDNSITEAKLNRTVDTWTAATGVASSDVTLINASSNSVVLTLPENGGTIGEGRIMVVKRIDNSANTVTISGEIADTIDSASSVRLYHRYETMTFVSDGANWFII